MRYDKKTGEKSPDSRTDEIRISLEQLYDIQKKCEGLMDRDFENNVLLKDISVSLGLITDMLGVLVNKIVGNVFSQDEKKKQ